MTAPPDVLADERGEGSGIRVGRGSRGTGDPPDPSSFTALFDRYFAEVHSYVARRLGPQKADDIAAETFLTAFRLRHRYDPDKGERRPWLYGIASNVIRRHRRDEARAFRAMARMDVPVSAANHADRVDAKVTAESLRGPLALALAGLAQGDRDVLLLVALAGLTYQEVAQALGISYGTVCSRLHRARQKVRPALGNPEALTEEKSHDR